MKLVRGKWTVAWKYWSNPASCGKWQAFSDEDLIELFFVQITGIGRAWRHQISCRCSTPCPAATTDPGRGSGSRRSSSKSGSVTVRHVWRSSTMTTSQASHSSQSQNSRSWIATQVLFRRFKNNLLSDMWSFFVQSLNEKNPFLRLISCFLFPA